MTSDRSRDHVRERSPSPRGRTARPASNPDDYYVDIGEAEDQPAQVADERERLRRRRARPAPSLDHDDIDYGEAQDQPVHTTTVSPRSTPNLARPTTGTHPLESVDKVAAYFIIFAHLWASLRGADPDHIRL
ncbi:hypothetical protein AC579_9924 [Pseudocercospora musae]|uniref:Uncharacterized protein n=1 Tax=Pseudocercospora musae TaxID=113226 RepID=A0A139I3T5_9PEZI|nr:hypothetical protein AC579_9924 [Pseudocercospora musae]KXT09275.1 hypothetical protein AC579_9924 [Pseudocercospora musae]KXT09277.1 hypothetical protein AC579_9924 [Pseudocercospora musae]KXT09284.1 hypothetical protein AC579_9924 [Pseudocercospora musae]